MDTQIFLVTFFTLASIDLGACVTSTKGPRTAEASTKPNQQVVYTAETARQSHTVAPNPGSSPNYRDDTKEKDDNLGFVNPGDFTSSLPKFDFDKSVDLFPEFFNSESQRSNRVPKYSSNIENDPYGSLTSSSSNHNPRKQESDANDGFVDPNIQFRSLFDAAETEGGFSPSDFLNYNNENSGAEGSKSSQTQAFPSYTYTGRRGDESDGQNERTPSNFQSSQPPKYRSTYRQVNSGRNPPTNGYGRNYNNGNHNDRNDSPGGARGPAPIRYNDGGNSGEYNNRNRRGPENHGGGSSSQESDDDDSPQASPSKGKGGDSGSGKSKCKKVTKQVDEEAEYSEYSPESDPYDPSTYQSRYKRQAARGKQGGNKRPMTCVVCEDEHGRYAEKCSYESNSDPNKKGGYFHSSSTSFTDNGNNNKPRGRRERYKRDPADSGDSTPFQLTPGSETESLPKRIQKRQSEGNRYASDFQGDDRSGQGGANPRGSHQNSYRVAGDGGGQFEYSPFISLVTEGNGGGRGTNENPNRNLEVEFGPPPNFGQSPENSPGYDFDFSIPKDLQQDISQSDTANTENRPIFSTGTGFGNDFDIGYDDYVKKHFPEAFGPTRPPGSDNQRQTGPSGGSAPSGTDAPSYHYRSPPPAPQRQFDDESYGPRGYGPSYPPRGPTKENTQQSRQYSPPPYYGGQEEVGPEHLEQAISRFNKKDRKDCEKVHKGGMTCFACRDSRGMREVDCMYASSPNDPRSGQMAYHEESEYSSHPHEQGPSHGPQRPQRSSAEESKRVENVTTAPTEYDFDY